MSLAQILEAHSIELDRLQVQQARDVLSAFDDARRALHERIRLEPKGNDATVLRLRAQLAQVEAGAAQLKDRLGIVMSSGERQAHQLALQHLTALVRSQEAGFEGMAGLVNVNAVARLAALDGLLLHRYSLDRYGADAVAQMQRAIASGVAQGLNQDQLAEMIAGAGGSVLDGLRGRAALIARMETGRAYNDGTLESGFALEEMDNDPADPYLKRIDEYFDGRNHPFSRAAHGYSARLAEPFRIPQGLVVQAGIALQRGIGGVVWPLADGVYVGMNLPAHFNDRGRITIWRGSWGETKLVPPGPDPAPAPAPPPTPVRPPPPPPPPVRPAGLDVPTGPTGADGTWSLGDIRPSRRGVPERLVGPGIWRPRPAGRVVSPLDPADARSVTDTSRVPKKRRTLVVSEWLGRDGEWDDLIAHAIYWTGVTEDQLLGATVSFEATEVGTIYIGIQNHRLGFHMERTFRDYIPRGGQRTASHQFFEIAERGQGRGEGARMFGRAADRLTKAGFAAITTTAAGGPGTGLNGYYTWPRLGFDASLTDYLIAKLPAELRAARRLSDLMATEAGRVWWRVNGGLLFLEFDLTPGSVSQAVLAAYLAGVGP